MINCSNNLLLFLLLLLLLLPYIVFGYCNINNPCQIHSSLLPINGNTVLTLLYGNVLTMHNQADTCYISLSNGTLLGSFCSSNTNQWYVTYSAYSLNEIDGPTLTILSSSIQVYSIDCCSNYTNENSDNLELFISSSYNFIGPLQRLSWDCYINSLTSISLNYTITSQEDSLIPLLDANLIFINNGTTIISFTMTNIIQGAIDHYLLSQYISNKFKQITFSLIPYFNGSQSNSWLSSGSGVCSPYYCNSDQYLPGSTCCVTSVQPDPVCCNPEETCSNKNDNWASFCCPQGAPPCLLEDFNSCCDVGQICTESNLCCNKGENECNGSCCLESQISIGKQGCTCCPINTTICNGECCSSGLSCISNKQCCLTGQIICGSTCCSPDKCINSKGICCGSDIALCNDECCPIPKQVCTGPGGCCGGPVNPIFPPFDVPTIPCNQSCCRDPYICADYSNSICCLPTYVACNGTCCYGTCSSGHCCPKHTSYCTEGVCVGDSCSIYYEQCCTDSSIPYVCKFNELCCKGKCASIGFSCSSNGTIIQNPPYRDCYNYFNSETCTSSQQCIETTFYGSCQNYGTVTCSNNSFCCSGNSCSNNGFCSDGSKCCDSSKEYCCGGSCCNRLQSCINNTCTTFCNGVYCSNEEYCNNNICCPQERNGCITSAGNICCDIGSQCTNGICCSLNQQSCKTSNGTICCPIGYQCNNGVCCPQNQYGCNTSNGSICCDVRSQCTNDNICCLQNQQSCKTSTGTICCDLGYECNNGVCCPQGSIGCKGSSSSICYTSDCSNNYHHCCTDSPFAYTCDINYQCCNGNCCDPTKMCVNNTCVINPNYMQCSDQCISKTCNPNQLCIYDSFLCGGNICCDINSIRCKSNEFGPRYNYCCPTNTTCGGYGICNSCTNKIIEKDEKKEDEKKEDKKKNNNNNNNKNNNNNNKNKQQQQFFEDKQKLFIDKQQQQLLGNKKEFFKDKQQQLLGNNKQQQQQLLENNKQQQQLLGNNKHKQLFGNNKHKQHLGIQLQNRVMDKSMIKVSSSLQLSYIGHSVAPMAQFDPLYYKYVSMYECKGVKYVPIFTRILLSNNINNINDNLFTSTTNNITNLYQYSFIPNSYNLLSFYFSNNYDQLSHNISLLITNYNGTKSIQQVSPNSLLLLSNFTSISFNSTDKYANIKLFDYCTNTFSTFNPYDKLKVTFPVTITYSTDNSIIYEQLFDLIY